MAQLSVGQEEMLGKEASWLTVLQEARGRRKARKKCVAFANFILSWECLNLREPLIPGIRLSATTKSVACGGLGVFLLCCSKAFFFTHCNLFPVKWISLNKMWELSTEAATITLIKMESHYIYFLWESSIFCYRRANQARYHYTLLRSASALIFGLSGAR